jgi:hypothetical protein
MHLRRSIRGVLHVVTAVALAMLCGAGAAIPQPPTSQPMARLWTVHIDEVRPAAAAEFERLNIAENRGIHAIMNRYAQPISPVYEIMMDGAVYMSMRSKLSFTDFDTPSTIPDSVSSLFSTVTDTLDGPIHAALKYHHNEVWRYQKADSYLPVKPGYTRPTPGYIQLISERVTPGMEDRYAVLLDSLKSALKKSDYPWCVLMFTSSYGDGAYKYFWQADSKAAFLEAGDRAAVLTAVFGKTTARAMLAEWQGCLAGATTVDATPRRDFSDLSESVPWLGLPPR